MKYQPKPGDLGTDLRRCLTASLEAQGFNSSTFKVFFKHVLTIMPDIMAQLDPIQRDVIKRSIEKVQDASLDKNKRQEHLLLASTFFLQSA